MRSSFGSAMALAGVMLLAGCSNTLSGAKQDATKDGQAVDTAASNAATATKQAASQVDAASKQAAASVKAATVLTPVIKTAIIRDPVLNDPHNQINVTTDATTVHLRGHVTDASMKQRAEQDTQVELQRHHSTAQVSDELTVTGAGS